ncbi:putative reverse transcriptase domain-containing protein [Tanacetum coccineum]
MAGRSTRSNTANNTNPPNEIADEVTQQLNTALPNLPTQLVQALGGNRENQREVAQSCSIKAFRASGAKEFFSTEGAVGLLTWFESIEYVLHITKCLAESQVEFTSTIIAQPWEDFKKLLMEEYYCDDEIQKLETEFWNPQTWDDFKKLLIEEYCPDDEIQKLETEFWNHKMIGSNIDGYTTRFHKLATLSAVIMANRLTTDGIKDGIFKKQENTGNKKRSNDQNKNQESDDRNKR